MCACVYLALYMSFVLLCCCALYVHLLYDQYVNSFVVVALYVSDHNEVLPSMFTTCIS